MSRFRRSIGFAMAMSLGAMPAMAQSLSDALVQSYQTNPQLQSQRKALRATDEAVPQALSGWRPTVVLNGTAGERNVESSVPSAVTGRRVRNETDLDPLTGSVTLTQPIFEGLRTVNQTAAAEAQVKAGRARLASVEQTILLQTVTAFMDVVRDQALLELQKNNEQVLKRQLEATQDRFRVGEVTRTDVAQAESRVARAIADRISATGNLVSTRANYQRVVGELPGTLASPDLPKLPPTEEEAVHVALEGNPDIRVAEFTAESAEYDIKTAFATLLPTVSFQVQHAYSEESATVGSRSTSTEVLGRVSVPLYQSGSEYSQVRQRKEVASQRRIDIEDSKRQVRQATIRAYEALTTATAALEAQREQVRAAEIAFEGARQEAEVGARTVLDVLDTEQELLNAQVRVVQFERDRVVAAYTLLQAMGTLTAEALALPVDIYDPTKHYNNVRWQFIGTSPRGEGGTKP